MSFVAALLKILMLCLQETLVQLLEGKPSCYSKEIQQLHNKHRKHFSKWMLQLQLSVVCIFSYYMLFCSVLNLARNRKCLSLFFVGWDSVCWSTVWAAKKLCWRISVCLTCQKKFTLWSMDSSLPSLLNQSVYTQKNGYQNSYQIKLWTGLGGDILSYYIFPIVNKFHENTPKSISVISKYCVYPVPDVSYFSVR